MPLTMFDLCAADADVRFSPYCWRIKMALAHKSLPCEFIPWHFTEKGVIAVSGQGAVPVLVDGETTLSDSWVIAQYLETHYPASSLFGGDAGMQATLTLKHWMESQVMPSLFSILILDIYDALDEQDKRYFRESREARLGMTLEAFCQSSPEHIQRFQKQLHPARLTLRQQPFLGGQQPMFSDYLLFSLFMWARSISATSLLVVDDPIYAWRERMLDLYDGLARKSPQCEAARGSVRS